MTLPKFKKGDRVRILKGTNVKNNKELIGLCATVADVSYCPFIILDKKYIHGHECGGLCKKGYGWNRNEDYLKLIKEHKPSEPIVKEPKFKFKIGDRVVHKRYGSGVVKGVYGYEFDIVEFDKKISGGLGHCCNSLCKDGHGYCCREVDLTLEEHKPSEPIVKEPKFKFKKGDRVEFLIEDRWPVGSKGTVLENDTHPWIKMDEYHSNGSSVNIRYGGGCVVGYGCVMAEDEIKLIEDKDLKLPVSESLPDRFKVKIVSCEKDTYWYADKIGEVYLCGLYDDYDYKVYDGNDKYFIKKSDCETVVDETVVDKIEYEMSDLCSVCGYRYGLHNACDEKWCPIDGSDSSIYHKGEDNWRFKLKEDEESKSETVVDKSKFKVGDRVIHKRHGPGVVKGVDSSVNIIYVEFDKKILGGHTCDGFCKSGHGQYCEEYELTLEHKPSESTVPECKESNPGFLFPHIGFDVKMPPVTFGVNFAKRFISDKKTLPIRKRKPRIILNCDN